jgi:hypothetical protein
LIKSNTGRICEVTWFQSTMHCGWDLRVANGIGRQPVAGIWDSAINGWEVIGNIYDNPDLLSKEA